MLLQRPLKTESHCGLWAKKIRFLAERAVFFDKNGESCRGKALVIL